MSECRMKLMNAGKPYPRTCQKCGLFGSCTEGLQDEEIARRTNLKAAHAKFEQATEKLCEAAAAWRAHHPSNLTEEFELRRATDAYEAAKREKESLEK